MANESQVVPIHLTILPWQQRMLQRIQAQRGLIGPSETLRNVLNHYAKFIGYSADITVEPQSDEESANPTHPVLEAA